MSVITRFHIENFKAFRDSTPIDITPFTLIVGPNGSGKTSILEAIELSFLHDHQSEIEIFYNTLKKINKKGKTIKVSISRKTKYLEITIDKENEEKINQYKNFAQTPKLTQERIEQLNQSTASIINNCFKRSPTNRHKKTTNFRSTLYHKKINLPCYDENEIPTLREDGYGLAAVIANMMTSEPERFVQLQDAVREVLPSIKRIRTRRAKVEREHIEILRVDDTALERPVKRELIGSELIFDTISGDNIPASDMSEGAMIVLALLTEILRPGGASLLLIDDLERGIHPGALHSFVAQLRALFKVREDLQIIATTHSPYLVSEFEREEILMTALDDEGYALCAPMTANDQWEKWKDIATTGEFWGLIGEEWIRELRKAR